MKKILIDIGHPAHVHYYRNMANELGKKGHRVFWTVKDIPIAMHLLDLYGVHYTILPKKSDDLLGKICKQVLYDAIIFHFCMKHKIDIAIGTSVSVAHVSRISKVASIVFDDDDDDVQPMVTRYVNPFANELLSPDALKGKRKRQDTIYYAGYHELAYLHPKRFIPNTQVLSEIGVREGEPYFMMRFNVFKAHHDVGVKGLSLEQKFDLVQALQPYGKIFITAEREIEPGLAKYQLKVRPDQVHSLIYHATLFLGDSQTMTSEAAMLGIPSLRCNSFAGRCSTLEEQQNRYGLTYAFTPNDFPSMLMKLKELLAMSDLKKEWQNRRQKMLADKIDVTAFWLWFVENYPRSADIMHKDPDYQYRFR